MFTTRRARRTAHSSIHIVNISVYICFRSINISLSNNFHLQQTNYLLFTEGWPFLLELGIFKMREKYSNISVIVQIIILELEYTIQKIHKLFEYPNIIIILTDFEPCMLCKVIVLNITRTKTELNVILTLIICFYKI